MADKKKTSKYGKFIPPGTLTWETDDGFWSSPQGADSGIKASSPQAAGSNIKVPPPQAVDSDDLWSFFQGTGSDDFWSFPQETAGAETGTPPQGTTGAETGTPPQGAAGAETSPPPQGAAGAETGTPLQGAAGAETGTPLQGAAGAETTAFSQKTGSPEFDELLETFGYSYDPVQDMFFSIMDPWQRKIGYCRLYDEASAPMGMIIDCEPVYFEYAEKKWLLEFWKGQYDYVTGGEVGIYIGAYEVDIPGIFNGIFYTCAGNADRLSMSFTLKKNGLALFSRKEVHWWLTGFKLGEFSEPWELTMDIHITFRDAPMRDAFVVGLRNAGYSDHEFKILENSVSLLFDVPHTPQPVTRSPVTDRIIQMKNERVCKEYQDITRPYTNILDKVNAVKEHAPALYEKMMAVGKSERLFAIYEKIKSYLKQYESAPE